MKFYGVLPIFLTYYNTYLKNVIRGQSWQLISVILPPQEAGIGKIVVWGQPRQKVSEILSQQNKPGIAVYICNPTTSEVRLYNAGRGEKPYLKNNLKQKDWRCSSS
jgi:hypothetical protein